MIFLKCVFGMFMVVRVKVLLRGLILNSGLKWVRVLLLSRLLRWCRMFFLW